MIMHEQLCHVHLIHLKNLQSQRVGYATRACVDQFQCLEALVVLFLPLLLRWREPLTQPEEVVSTAPTLDAIPPPSMIPDVFCNASSANIGLSFSEGWGRRGGKRVGHIGCYST